MKKNIFTFWKRIKLIGDTRTQLKYEEYIGVSMRNLKEGDTFIKKVELYDTMLKSNRKSKVMLNVIAVDKRQIDVEVI